jgi:hypothetical protein
VGIGQLS